MEALLIKIFFHPVTLIILGILAFLDTEIPWRIEMFFQKIKLKQECKKLNEITDFLRDWPLIYIRESYLEDYFPYWKHEYLLKLVNANILILNFNKPVYNINKNIL